MYSNETFLVLNLAHTTTRDTVALLEEKLLNKMLQVCSLAGHELFKDTCVLVELLMMPPPVSRSPLGQKSFVSEIESAGSCVAGDCCWTYAFGFFTQTA